MAVSMGGNFLVAVDERGCVLACGQNDTGQIGQRARHGIDVTGLQYPLLRDISFDFEAEEHSAVMVSAGRRHAAFVTRSGSVYTWGNGAHGALGNGVEEEHLLPQLTPQLAYSTLIHRSRATMVACGDGYTLLLAATGHVWGCGKNQYFQIGVQNMDDPLQVSNRDIRVFTRMPPERFDCGDGDTQIAFIAAGVHHSAAVGRTNGLLWTWGAGGGGRLGHGDGTVDCSAPVPVHLPRDTFWGENVVLVSVHRHITMAITTKGALWVAGCSGIGLLGLGTVQRCITFQRVGTAAAFGDGGVRNVVCTRFHSLILSHDGSLWACGSVDSGCFDPNIFRHHLVPTRIDPACFNYEPVVLISAGESRNVAVTRSGRLFTWGWQGVGDFHGLAYRVDSPERGECRPYPVLHMAIPDEPVPRFGLWTYAFSVDEMLAFAMGAQRRRGAAARYTVSDEMMAIIRNSLMVTGASRFGIGLRNILGI